MQTETSLAAVAVDRLPGGNLPVVVSIPHAGRTLPQFVVDDMRVSTAQIMQLADGWCDLLAADLFVSGATIVRARHARAVADCNRHEGDMAPVEVSAAQRHRFGPPGRKARAGLGVVPTRLWSCGALWRGALTETALESRLEWLHRPYHAALAGELKRVRAEFGAVLLIDLHSMPTLTAHDPAAPVVVIGDNHGRSAAPLISAALLNDAVGHGWRAQRNDPYAGGHIVQRHGSPARGIDAVQIEFDRQLYLAGDGTPDADRCAAISQWLANAVMRIVAAQFEQRQLAAE